MVLLLVGVLLIWFSLSKINLDLLQQELLTGDYFICIPVFAISMTGYGLRILRWNLMLKEMGEVCRKRSLYAALCMGYLVSFIVPRLGEVSRALILKKTDNIKVDFTLISIVIERILDTIVLFGLLLVAVIMNGNLLLAVFDFNRNSWRPLANTSSFYIVLLLVISAIVILLYVGIRKKVFHQLMQRYRNAIQGLRKAVLRIDFWIYTIGIWICYYLMTFLWFYLFDSSMHLTWKDAFLVMVVGSFGRSIPVQGGGMGAYHFIVSRTLVLMGLSLVTGNALAIVIHGAQAVLTFVTGTLGYLWMIYDLNKRKVKTVN